MAQLAAVFTWFDAVEFCNALSKSEGLPEYYALRDITRRDGAITSAESCGDRSKSLDVSVKALAARVD